MAGAVNKVILVGNLGKDPEVRTTQDGTKVVNLTLATGESWTNKAGERQERTEWHTVVIWNERLGDVAERFCRKGSKIYIEGALQTRKWTDRDGNDRYSTEVVLSRFRGELTLLDSKRDSEAPREEPRAAPQRAAGGGRQKVPAGPDMDDEIPF